MGWVSGLKHTHGVGNHWCNSKTRITYVENAVSERRNLLLLNEKLVVGIVDLSNVKLEGKKKKKMSRH